MPARKAPDLNNYFSSAKQSQYLSEAEKEIQRLKLEIEELRNNNSGELEAQLKELRGQLQLNSGVIEVPLERIEANPEQPRQTFLKESIESMSHSLAREGQLQPIILITHKEKFVLFDGERRWRSAKTLGWQTLQAVIIPEPVNLHRKALLTSLHREDLNPLDKAEAIMRELATSTGLDVQDIPRILSTVVRRLNAQKRIKSILELIASDSTEQQQKLDSLNLSESERSVLSLLLDLQLNPASIDANVFPILSLAEDLKVAIRGGLKGVHAMALQKLSAKNLDSTEEEAQSIRVEITQKVIAEKLSVIATRKLVAGVIASRTETPTIINTDTKSVIQASRTLQQISLDSFKKIESSQLIEFQEILRQKLAEIEEAIKQKSD
ncbi:MAG: ParB/RepB/Spo0J family partition protein [Trichormus sp. ATA11-4-KO1]|jgi:ParB family chromosome partitioning protein|nr:ParB/RepB/Spo0J family partition protein [Trichormus sp. ATA11-4-KO1]